MVLIQWVNYEKPVSRKKNLEVEIVITQPSHNFYIQNNEASRRKQDKGTWD